MSFVTKDKFSFQFEIKIFQILYAMDTMASKFLESFPQGILFSGFHCLFKGRSMICEPY